MDLSSLTLDISSPDALSGRWIHRLEYSMDIKLYNIDPMCSRRERGNYSGALEISSNYCVYSHREHWNSRRHEDLRLFLLLPMGALVCWNSRRHEDLRLFILLPAGALVPWNSKLKTLYTWSYDLKSLWKYERCNRW
jgi:hypothetical protein